MGETGNERRVGLDLLLAGLICLAAFGYWSWDSQSSSGPGETQPSSVPAPAKSVAAQSVAAIAAQEIAANQLNDSGYRLFSASDFAGAEAKFRGAIRVHPKGAVGFSNLGAALIAQRRFEEAIAALATAIALDPSLELARNNLHWAVEEKAKSRKE
jgi:tetratricopeptide (TPR) repeat protein